MAARGICLVGEHSKIQEKDMPIHDLCFKNVVTIHKDVSMEEACKRMRNEHVGVLVVTDKGAHPIGILTDRDVVVAGIALGRSLSSPIEDIMTKDVLLVPKGAGVADVIARMEKREVRRALVVDKDNKPCGLISSDDLLQLLGNELNSLGNLVRRQIDNEGLRKAV